MYSFLPEVCHQIRLSLIEVYWNAFPMLLILACILEMLKSAPDVKGITLRSFVSVLLLLSFPMIFNNIAEIGDSLSATIRQEADVWNFLEDLQKKTLDLNFDWLNLKSGVLFVLNLLSYFVSYLGFFFTNAIIHFMWAILYVLSPLMILACVFKSTVGITINLYSSMIKVMSWKVLYTLLSVLLIKFIQVENLQFGDDNFITTIVINLCVGISMLFIPMFASSLFGNALTGFTSGMAMASVYPIAGTVKSFSRARAAEAKVKGQNIANRGIDSSRSYLAKKVPRFIPKAKQSSFQRMRTKEKSAKK